MDLLLITANYPYGDGEFFIDNEMRIISERFDRIFVLTAGHNGEHVPRFLPSNARVIEHEIKLGESNKISAIDLCFKPFFLNELLRTVRRLGFSSLPATFKRMFIDALKGRQIKRLVIEIVEQYSIPVNNALIYSYWHDFRALGLAMLRLEDPRFRCIARAHGWDVFSERQSFPYLPFKQFMIDRLNTTFTVSEIGKNRLLEQAGSLHSEKIKLARLGTLNPSGPNESNGSDNLLFCSCSRLIALKRVHLIADIIKRLKGFEIKWVHFGDGPLREELSRYVHQQLPEVDFELTGAVANEDILHFYRDHRVDLFFNMSESEGVPVSIMEALSAGIPVVATDVGGTREIVDARHGFLVNAVPDMAALAAILTRYLKAPHVERNELRTAARSFWQKYYRADHNYSKFADQLEQI